MLPDNYGNTTYTSAKHPQRRLLRHLDMTVFVISQTTLRVRDNEYDSVKPSMSLADESMNGNGLFPSSTSYPESDQSERIIPTY